ncbi:MAG: tetratricopeptide repeat protein, partial [Candidatus Eiseniibacteriota bacterium]
SRGVGGVSYLSQSGRTVHVGLGASERAESVVVRWPGREPQRVGALAAGAIWEIEEGSATPHRVEPRPPSGGEETGGAGDGTPRLTGSADAAPTDRERLAEFWRRQRAAMHAVKVDGDLEAAIPLFESALELNPTHADSLYYLGNCLADTGDVEGALARFAEIARLDPQSHRAHKRWGTLRAMSATAPEQLAEAVAALERASAINREETGVPLVLGEVELMRGDLAAARRRLEWVVGSNPQSGEAYFVLGYLDWREGRDEEALELLETAVAARGEHWKPADAVAEGEVERRMHVESTPFEQYWQAWDGTPSPAAAFAALDAHLRPGS